MTAMKSELCVCGHDRTEHFVPRGPSNGVCGRCCNSEWSDDHCPEFGMASAAPTVVMAKVDGLPVIATYIATEVPGRVFPLLRPVSQCQADWPWPYELEPSPESGFDYVVKDLEDKKPARLNEPLQDCPGSCTEPAYAHRGNVVCSSDESRRLIE